MEQYCLFCIKRDLQKIADMLILNGTLTDCPGLVHGKTGIAVFFFHYAQYTNNDLYNDYAMDLIVEIQAQLHNNSLADYERGIAGIGLGINYLMQNSFLDSDGDIFADFDKRMYRAIMYDPWQDFSLYEGLTGHGRYWIMRLCQQQLSSTQARECLLSIVEHIKENLTNIPANERTDVYCFLHDLHRIPDFDICTGLLAQFNECGLNKTSVSQCFPRLGSSIVGNIVRIFQFDHYFNHSRQNKIDAALKQIPDWDIEKPPTSMELLTGYAGEGMLRLTALQQNNLLWMNLL